MLLHDGARCVFREINDVDDKCGQDRQQHLKIVTSKFRVPHLLPASYLRIKQKLVSQK